MARPFIFCFDESATSQTEKQRMHMQHIIQIILDILQLLILGLFLVNNLLHLLQHLHEMLGKLDLKQQLILSRDIDGLVLICYSRK